MALRGSTANLTKVIRELRRRVGDALETKHMRVLAEEAIRMIVVRTRLGYGVRANDEKRSKLEALSKPYVEYRKRNRSDLHRLTRPGRSNLTFTGQMLDSMQVTKLKFGQVHVGTRGRRTDGKTNEQIAYYVTKQGRPFNNLSDLELKKIRRFFENTLRSALSKSLT